MNTVLYGESKIIIIFEMISCTTGLIWSCCKNFVASLIIKVLPSSFSNNKRPVWTLATRWG